VCGWVWVWVWVWEAPGSEFGPHSHHQSWAWLIALELLSAPGRVEPLLLLGKTRGWGQGQEGGWSLGWGSPSG
jgi:hypothetical protein